VITPADLVRWGADFAIDRPLDPRELAALPVPPRDLVWVLAHAVTEATRDAEARPEADLSPLELVRDVARTSASFAMRSAAPGEPGWREAVAEEDRRQIEQMVTILEGT